MLTIEQILHGEGFTKEQCMTFIPAIYENILRNVKACVLASEKLGIPIREKKNQETAKEIKEIDGDAIMNAASVWTSKLALQIEELWQDEGIQATYKEKSKFQVEDSIEYYLANIKRIAAEGYMPSVMDILRTRKKTTGIVETEFVFFGATIVMIDVGGQRSERKKWIHCFEGVTAIIYVTSLAEYDQRCYEDDITNRMKESMQLFSEVCAYKYFRETPMIMFFNKVDIFEEKLKKTELKTVFEDYTGDNSLESAIQFIQDKYDSLANPKDGNANPTKDIYKFVTCATDSEQLKKVFSAVSQILLKDTMGAVGMM